MTSQDNTQPDRPIHGGIKPAELRALGWTPEEVLDFSARISPIGPPEGIWQAIAEVELAAYPDPHCLELIETLARHLSSNSGSGQTIDSGRLLFGNGSTEIIHLLARAYLPSPSKNHRSEMSASALILTPTYGEYQGACALQEALVSPFNAGPPPDFRWDLEAASELISSRAPQLVFLCNPNNPTGSYLEQKEVETLADAVGLGVGLLILDEAYVSFVEQPWDSLAILNHPNVVILRSMTKDYALTGLRAGYCISSEPVISRLAAYQPDWSVNGLAQAGVMAALADTDYLTRARFEVARSKEFMIKRLDALGFEVPPSAANFLLARVGDAGSWRDQLARKGMFVRDCTSFGLSEFIRIGIRSLPDCQRLMETMEALA